LCTLILEYLRQYTVKNIYENKLESFSVDFYEFKSVYNIAKDAPTPGKIHQQVCNVIVERSVL
jgi:hypothetical protein